MRRRKKKASEEVQHPVLNQGCFLKKPAFPLSRLNHLWSLQPSESCREEEKIPTIADIKLYYQHGQRKH